MVSEKMLNMGKKKSPIRDLFEYGRIQEGIVGKENVFDFSLGNPNVPPPDEVAQAFRDIVTSEPPLLVHGYTSAVGNNQTRDAMALHLSKQQNQEFTRKNIFITCGAAAALMACFKGLTINSQTEFISIAPFFPEYLCFVESAGAKLVVVPPSPPDFNVNFEELEKAITPRTQALIVNSPNNPTGVIYSEKTIETIASILLKKAEEYGHPIYIISDEPYREIVYDDAVVPFIPNYYNNTIICYSYSKSLSLPGDRIGYMFVSDKMEDFDDICFATAGAARALGYVCAPAIMQRVIARCAEVKVDIVPYDINRHLLFDSLTSIGFECVPPKGAFYLFVKAPFGLTDKEFSSLAKEKNLLLVPGTDFGCPGYLRISYCVSSKMILKSIPIFKALFTELQEKSKS